MDLDLFAGAGIMMIFFIAFGIAMIPFIFYLITLQNTFNEISFENRQLPAGQVWLLIIPLFGIVWHFIVVNRLADSLRAEFDNRNIQENEIKPGRSIGLAQCILNCCGIIPFFGILTSIASLVCWIIYWVKINNFKTMLQYN